MSEEQTENVETNDDEYEVAYKEKNNRKMGIKNDKK